MDGAIVELGYLGIEASQPEAWRDFLIASVGLDPHFPDELVNRCPEMEIML